MIPYDLKYPKRLLALADHIEKIPQEVFSMDQFREDDHMTLEGCGTVGCILGHAPALIREKRWVPLKAIVVNPKNLLSRIDWLRVSGVFGIHSNMAIWDYLFGAFWETTDNTPKGAAKRIRWAVKHGGIPSNWHEQMKGHVPVSFKEKQ
jgi:hypothetical protein